MLDGPGSPGSLRCTLYIVQAPARRFPGRSCCFLRKGALSLFRAERVGQHLMQKGVALL